MTLQEQISELERQKQALKVSAYTDIQPHTFEYEGITIQVDAIDDHEGMVKITATVDGVQDVHLFKNPPILVPDGTTRTEQNADGEMVERPNFKEDVLEAMHLALGGTIKLSR
jgi:hypothetical protein